MLFKYGISPNKLIDYMMSGQPILNAIEAGNPKAIAKGILKIYNMTAEERHDMGAKGKQYVLQRHTYPILATSFLQAMEER